MDKRLLILNIYFAPRSFGGATIVAEEMAKRLTLDHGWRVLVLTTLNDPYLMPYTIRRYHAKGIEIIGVNVPADLTFEEMYGNPKFAQVAERVISVYQPTVIQIHCIQEMGCGYFAWLKKTGIPLVLTVHDCWWICERQFMVNGHGQHCFQHKIDHDQCRYCINDFDKTKKRINYLGNALNNVDIILFPSDFHRDLHINNGFPVQKCHTNKNGVKLPDRNTFLKTPCSNGRVRFGFTGGPGPMKGADLIVNAFREINSDNYELLIADAARYMGSSWKDFYYWDIPGKVTFTNPYNLDIMDSFFCKIDVLLFPSQCKESFGLTVREAMSRNVWVIATEAGGVVEDIKPGVNGDIIPMDGDYRQLKDCIINCLDRKDWQNYRNPLVDEIRGFDEQADELANILAEISSK